VEIGVAVPTMGTRPELLKQCLQSIREAGPAFVAIVAPDKKVVDYLDRTLFDLFVPDPMLGLAAAINAGISALPETASFVNWLGDDDLLTPGSLSITLNILTNNPKAVLAYGGCEYIDENGVLLWTNKSGRYASTLLHFGPQLIPQPGALIRRDAYTAIGGLNTSYKWAFDLDLLFRLKKLGKLHFVDVTLAKFRWHEGSLSVGGRKGSVNEASSIRRASLPRIFLVISLLWEIPMRRAIFSAGNRLNRKLKRNDE
jgi:GT2 family glycosyltransferase